MVNELRESIASDKILFGQRECTKHMNKLQKIFVPSDARTHVTQPFEKAHIAIERLDLTRKELADKLALAFFCEMFGVTK